MKPDEIIRGIKSKNQMLTQKNEELIELSEIAAQAKKKYAIALATELLSLKSLGHPATLIKELAQGNKVVAELRFEKDVAKGVHDACRESIKDIRTHLDSYRSILTWEREERFSHQV